MHLVSFTAQNYRSITRASKLPLGDVAVLIGPNNEGKSNILRALSVVLSMIANPISFEVYRQRIVGATVTGYTWERDYPVNRQKSKPDGESTFILEFELTDDERKDFRTQVGSQITGTLPIEITLGRGRPGFRVVKQGPGAATLSKKLTPIARFISQRLDFQYIPAVRTASRAQRVVEDLVARSLAPVEDDPAYKGALDSITRLQQPILEAISENIRETLAVFLPDVKNVKVEVSTEERSQALRRSCRIIVDDGTPTLLDLKGDGVQSLAALSLMRYASQMTAGQKNLILAIEEPESHLHPRAIHQLRAVLKEISEKHQIIMTTHCPLFVDRVNIRHNILVAGSKAAPARGIAEIRNLLGVRLADNLAHAELVLVVEGADDSRAVQSLLRHHSRKLRAGLADGALALDSLGGASHLSYKLAHLRDAICSTHSFLDDDEAAHRAFDKATGEGLLSLRDVTFSICEGMQQAELEDMYDPAIYSELIKRDYRVDISIAAFHTSEKWSERMKNVFRAHGKPWTDSVEAGLKDRIAGIVDRSPQGALSSHKRQAFDALLLVLEDKLSEIGSG